jgi:hypothetical protein
METMSPLSLRDYRLSSSCHRAWPEQACIQPVRCSKSLSMRLRSCEHERFAAITRTFLYDATGIDIRSPSPLFAIDLLTTRIDLSHSRLLRLVRISSHRPIEFVGILHPLLIPSVSIKQTTQVQRDSSRAITCIVHTSDERPKSSR